MSSELCLGMGSWFLKKMYILPTKKINQSISEFHCIVFEIFEVALDIYPFLMMHFHKSRTVFIMGGNFVYFCT